MATHYVSIPMSRSVDQGTVDAVHLFVTDHALAKAERVAPRRDPFWDGLKRVRTELWLDTGDIDAAGKLWNDAFTALTTNNTLLNTEVQKGTYDQAVPAMGRIVAPLDRRTQVLEAAFALNVLHGLRLARRFGAKVSVEMHTDLAHDVERTVFYGKRAYNICPEQFLVKVPLTPAGLVAARQLGQSGVPINLTLGFSARHNVVITAAAKPAYVNVFLGRLNAYVKDNGLGDGANVGERALIASQREVAALGGGTRQIAASMRDAKQIAALAGADVFTMPTKVAESAAKELDGRWQDHRATDYPVVFNDAGKAARPQTLWDVSEREHRFAQDLAKAQPKTGEEVASLARSAGCADLFPTLSEADRQRIAADGKIPKHAAWADRVAKSELAIDTLLNLAGLAAFTADQAALDARLAKLLG